MRLHFMLLLFFAKNIVSTPLRIKYNDIIIRGKENAYITEIVQDSPILTVHSRQLGSNEYLNKDNIIIKIIANPQFLTNKPRHMTSDRKEEVTDPPIGRDGKHLIVAEFDTEERIESGHSSKKAPIKKRSVKQKRDLLSSVLKALTGLGYDSYYKNYMKTIYPERYNYNIDRVDWSTDGANQAMNDYYYQNRRMQPKIVYGWIDKKDYNLAYEMNEPDGIPWT